jgi:hypothetical protein
MKIPYASSLTIKNLEQLEGIYVKDRLSRRNKGANEPFGLP